MKDLSCQICKLHIKIFDESNQFISCGCAENRVEHSKNCINEMIKNKGRGEQNSCIHWQEVKNEN